MLAGRSRYGGGLRRLAIFGLERRQIIQQTIEVTRTPRPIHSAQIPFAIEQVYVFGVYEIRQAVAAAYGLHIRSELIAGELINRNFRTG